MYAKFIAAAAAIILVSSFCYFSPGAIAAGVNQPAAAMQSDTTHADSSITQAGHRGHWRGGHWHGGPRIIIAPYPYYGYRHGYYYDDEYYYRHPNISPCYRRCRHHHGPRYCFDRCER
jgi:hypothetical protein